MAYVVPGVGRPVAMAAGWKAHQLQLPRCGLRDESVPRFAQPLGQAQLVEPDVTHGAIAGLEREASTARRAHCRPPVVGVRLVGQHGSGRTGGADLIGIDLGALLPGDERRPYREVSGVALRYHVCRPEFFGDSMD